MYAARVDEQALDAQEDNKQTVIADVAVDVRHGASSQDVLSYAVPGALRQRLSSGQLVWVPLRRQTVLGLVLRLHRDLLPFTVKPIAALVEPTFCLNQDQLDVAAWLARTTASTLFAAASPFFPPGVLHRAVEYLRLVDREALDRAHLTPVQRQLVILLTERGDITTEQARAALGRSLTSVITALEAKGVIERTARVIDKPPASRLERYLRLVSANPDDVAQAPRQRSVIEYLTRRQRLAPTGSDGLVRTSEVLAHTQADHHTLAAMARKGVIELVRKPAPARMAERHAASAPALTSEQAVAWRAIERALSAGDPTPILVHGVTGSGKTELYLRAVAWCLRHGRSAIILVPEIALASQVVRRFEARFGDQVAVLHSDLPDAERYATWQDVARGERRVVVGPRSALFAPVRDPGLIVVDEEHEGAYKQESEPRYHARSLAEYLARQQRAVLLLGSATPAVETRWRADAGEIHRLTLATRPGVPTADPGTEASPGLPAVDVIDMRLELHRGRASVISTALEELLARTLSAGEQAILFLNRRGMATVVVCRQCGDVVLCPQCDIPLVYHHDRERLLCHRCNLRLIPPRACAACGGPLSYFGTGTQRVEREVQRLFPHARVLRWDQDAVRRDGGHARLLKRVERREADIIVGTQMIAKGLDLPMVTAIGVVHADGLLFLPDFRSAERTFQLLTQVAGRAGRRTPGARVIIQTYSPAHYAIQAASRHDYDAFYAEEIDFRRKHGYPPFTRLIRCIYRHQDEAQCAAEAEDFARQMARHARARGVRIDLLGPTPAFVSRIRGVYQWHFVVRADPSECDKMLDGLPHRPGWMIDVDPQSLL